MNIDFNTTELPSDDANKPAIPQNRQEIMDSNLFAAKILVHASKNLNRADPLCTTNQESSYQ